MPELYPVGGALTGGRGNALLRGQGVGRILLLGNSDTTGTGQAGGNMVSTGGILGQMIGSEVIIRGNGGSADAWDGIDIGTPNNGEGGWARMAKEVTKPGVTTLATAMTATDTTATVVHGTGGQTASEYPFPDLSGTYPAGIEPYGNHFYAWIDRELVLVTAITGTNGVTWTVTRAQAQATAANGSTLAEPHQAGAEVREALRHVKSSKPFQVVRPLAVTQPELKTLTIVQHYHNCRSRDCAANGIGVYAQSRASSLMAHRWMMSRARSSYIGESNLSGAWNGTTNMSGVIAASGTAGSAGGWLSSSTLDANAIKRCSGNTYFYTPTVGDGYRVTVPTTSPPGTVVAICGLFLGGSDNVVLRRYINGVAKETLASADVITPTSAVASPWIVRFPDAVPGDVCDVKLETRTAGYMRCDTYNIESTDPFPCLWGLGRRLSSDGAVASFATTKADMDAKAIEEAEAVRVMATTEFVVPGSNLPSPVVPFACDVGNEPFKFQADKTHLLQPYVAQQAANAAQAWIGYLGTDRALLDMAKVA